MKKFVLMVLSCMGLSGLADVQINNLEARQRYPWNGKVDITFDVVANAGSSGMIQVKANDSVRNSSVVLRAFTLDGVAHHAGYDELGKYPVPVLPGSHTIVWNSLADQYFTDYGPTRLTYEISISPAHQSSPDAIGKATGNLGDVLTVDLTTGTISSFPQVDTGTFNCDTYRTTKMAFVKIAAGAYVVGTGETVTSPVTLTKDYYIGIHQVTRTQYQTVMQSDPSDASSSEGRRAPVQMVSWTAITQAGGFLAKVNQKITAAGGTFQIQLPTEAQWEIAARAGTTTLWFFGATVTSASLGRYAWCGPNNTGALQNKTHTVGMKLANPWGLYDVYGNVWEWCQDWWGNAYPSAPQDPTGASSGSSRTLRGGHYSSGSNNCNSGCRNRFDPGNMNEHIGFRAALALAPASL